MQRLFGVAPQFDWRSTDGTRVRLESLYEFKLITVSEVTFGPICRPKALDLRPPVYKNLSILPPARESKPANMYNWRAERS